MSTSKVKIGDIFGKLTVVSRCDTKRGTCIDWVCECECGNTRVLPSNYLTTGQTTHCGCSTPRKQPKDITGEKLNKLTAIKNTGRKSGNGDYIWTFQCDCGNTTEVTIGNFHCGGTKSCGCAIKDAAHTKSNYHGMQYTPEYNSWRKMRERCLSKKDPLYHVYGGAGITICDEWLGSFNTFFKDMGRQPFNGCTIDRIDLTKGYYLGNCRWASNYVQARNKTSWGGSSRYKGVQYEKSSNKWIATITVGDIKVKKIGRYIIEEHAAKAYNLASELIFGEDCSYLTLNPVDRDYSCVNMNCKFFRYWLPLMIVEKKDKYINDDSLIEEGE